MLDVRGVQCECGGVVKTRDHTRVLDLDVRRQEFRYKVTRTSSNPISRLANTVFTVFFSEVSLIYRPGRKIGNV